MVIPCRGHLRVWRKDLLNTMRHALILIAFVASGCVSTQRIDVGVAHETDAYNEAHSHTEAAVRIEENDSPRTLRADSTSLGSRYLTIYMRGVEIELPLESVHFVQLNSGKQAVVSAMALGASMGAVSGAMVGIGVGDPASCDGICFYQRDMALFFGGMGSMAGGIAGGAVGASRTERQIIRFVIPER